jgi:hypothetical protein
MTTHSRFLAVSFFLASTKALALTPFVGDYAVFDGDKRLGSAQLSLKALPNGKLEFVTHTEGKGGMAGFLGAEIKERSVLSVNTERLQSHHYRYEQSVAFRDRHRQIDFDYRAGTVAEDDGKRQSSYRLTSAALDRHAVVLALALDLSKNGAPGEHQVAHKGALSAWQFKVIGEESLVLGGIKLDTVKIERLRENSERSTISWHARAFDFLPVQIEQIEPNGDRYRLQWLRWIEEPK